VLFRTVFELDQKDKEIKILGQQKEIQDEKLQYRPAGSSYNGS